MREMVQEFLWQVETHPEDVRDSIRTLTAEERTELREALGELRYRDRALVLATEDNMTRSERFDAIDEILIEVQSTMRHRRLRLIVDEPEEHSHGLRVFVPDRLDGSPFQLRIAPETIGLA